MISSASLPISGFDGWTEIDWRTGEENICLYSTYERRWIEEHPEYAGWAISGVMPDRAALAYYEQLDACQECKGIGECPWHGILHVPDVEEADKMIVWRTRRCTPNVTANAERVLRIRQRAANLPKKYWTITASDFDGKGNAIALAAVRSFATDRQSVMLYGGRGCGKTMLACIMANAALKNGEQVVFFSVAEMNTTLRGAIADGSLEALIKRMIKADVLILDDIGAEAATSWTMEQLFVIVNGRYNDGDGRMIITSNCQPVELRKDWARINDVGERIFSRLSEMCIFAEVNGYDRRLSARAPAAR